MQRDGTIDRRLLERETAELVERDRRDAGRAVAPLREPPDAVRIDTTTLTFAEQVARIVELARERRPALGALMRRGAHWHNREYHHEQRHRQRHDSAPGAQTLPPRKIPFEWLVCCEPLSKPGIV